MLCKKCGYETKTGSRFCQNCGESVESPGKSGVVKSKTFRQEIKETTDLLNNLFPYYGEVMVLLGSGVFVYSFFKLISGLSVREYTPGIDFRLWDFEDKLETIYKLSFELGGNDLISAITIGVVLVVLGTLIIRNRNKKVNFQ